MTKVAVLEAVIAASIMLSGVAYVVTQQPVGAGPQNIDRLIEVRAHDFLATSRDLPLKNACPGASALRQMLIEGIAGETATWDQRRARYFDPGIETNLYLMNGRGSYPIYEPRDFLGVTSDVHWPADFTHTVPIPAAGWTGTETVPLHTAAFRDGTLQRLAGEAVRFSVASTSGASTQTSLAWGPTALRDAPALGIYWLSQSGGPELTRSLSNEDINPHLTERRTRFELVVASEGGIPAGLSLSLRFPADWEILPETFDQNTLWNVQNSEGGRTTEIGALLATAVEKTAPFKLFVRVPTTSVSPFQSISASTANGSRAESTLVVTYPTPIDAELPREVFPTTPYPIALGSSPFFGLAFANGPEPLMVTQVDIEIPGGYDLWRNEGKGAALFAEPVTEDRSLPGLRPTDGWTWIDEKHVQWRGEVQVSGRDADWWGLHIPITTDASQVTSIDVRSPRPLSTNISFANGVYDVSSLWSSSPGILRHRIEAQGSTSGYPTDLLVKHPFTVNASNYRSFHEQDWSYTVLPDSSALKLQNGVTNSSFQVRERLVRVGGVLEADADLQSVFTTLAAQGATNVELNISVYAPPSIGCRPSAAWDVPAGSLPKAGANALELWNAEGVAGSLFVALEDNYVHRIETGGAPRWSDASTTATSFLELGDLDGAPSIVTLRGLGEVTRASATTGARVWSVDAGPALPTSLDLDASAKRVLVATYPGGLRLLDATDGATLAHGWNATRHTNARLLPDGNILAIHNGSFLVRHNADLTLDRASLLNPNGPILDYAIGDGVIHVASQRGTTTLRTSDLSITSSSPSILEIVLAASGDLNDDGFEELATAYSDLTLAVKNGRTGATSVYEPSYTQNPSRSYSPGDVITTAQAAACHPNDPVSFDDMDVLDEDAMARRYSDTPICQLRDEAKAYTLNIQNGKLAYVFSQWRNHHVCLFESDLDAEWCRAPQPNLVPKHATIGPFSVHPQAVAIAYEDGTIEIRAIATGDVLETIVPGQVVGKFTIRAPVPLGGFYGTHLVIASIQWQDAGGIERHVSLADWFEAVDIDGTPVQSPTYRVILVARDRGDAWGSR